MTFFAAGLFRPFSMLNDNNFLGKIKLFARISHSLFFAGSDPYQAAFRMFTSFLWKSNINVYEKGWLQTKLPLLI